MDLWRDAPSCSSASRRLPESSSGAAYIVTGAAGALGQLVAAWLIRQGAIVWSVDRKPVGMSAPHVSTIADVGDFAAMRELFDRIDASGAPLRGVFHCAAIVDDDRLEQQTGERLSAVLAAKVDGALVLDRLTRERRSRLDHFVLFASIVGVLPSARQSGYAAANAVLDQIAQARRRDGLPGSASIGGRGPPALVARWVCAPRRPGRASA